MDENAKSQDDVEVIPKKVSLLNVIPHGLIPKLDRKDTEFENEKFRRHSAMTQVNPLTNDLANKRKKRMTYLGLNYIDTFFEDIPNILQHFFSKYSFKNKVESFLMHCPIREGLDYFLQAVHNFPEFNMFDYLCGNITPPNNKIEIEKRKQFYIKRNNIFFAILLYSKQTSETLFFMDKQIDYFIRANLENTVLIDIEVDYFLLSVFGYKDKARNLLIKQNEYFKSHLKNLNIKEHDITAFFNKLDIEKDVRHQSIDEIVFIRRTLTNIITRRCYAAIEKLLALETIYILMLEGRIWKAIITEFTREEVLEIWMLYHSSIKTFLKKNNYYEDNSDPAVIKRRIYIHTIENEYNVKITNLKDEEEMLKEKEQKTNELTEYETYARQRDLVTREREELERETALIPIIEFVDLLRIIFLYNKKEVALMILDSPLTGIDPTLEIFEICLNHDEDLAM
jgi:hypothetical protein